MNSSPSHIFYPLPWEDSDHPYRIPGQTHQYQFGSQNSKPPQLQKVVVEERIASVHSWRPLRSPLQIALTEQICCIWSKLMYYQHQTGYEQQTGCANDPRPYHAVPTRHLQPGHHRKRPSAPTLPKPATGRFGIPPVPNVKGRKPSLSD